MKNKTYQVKTIWTTGIREGSCPQDSTAHKYVFIARKMPFISNIPKTIKYYARKTTDWFRLQNVKKFIAICVTEAICMCLGHLGHSKKSWHSLFCPGRTKFGKHCFDFWNGSLKTDTVKGGTSKVNLYVTCKRL